MAKKITLIMILILALSWTGCDENDSDEGLSPTSVEGLNLLGLVNNRSLYYFQLDTTTLVPSFEVEIDSLFRTINIAGSGTGWVVSDDDQPLINLLITNHYILQNGYWQDAGAVDSLYYFPIPSVLMMRSFENSVPWKDYTPPLATDSGNIHYPFYYSYFGFYFEKTFVGTEQLVLTPGEFTAYRFDTDLYLNRTDTVPVATATEYYTPNIGLIKLVFTGQGLKRYLYLVSYH
ncbi:MAG: hypothetical protein ACOYVF_02240 [Candidatus Zixiibacteriota bacterium]